MISTNDIVKITDSGKLYTTYPSFFVEEDKTRLMKNYTYGACPSAEEAELSLFRVLHTGNHHESCLSERRLCIISNSVHTYIIEDSGLMKASIELQSDTDDEDKIQVGDEVRVKDRGNCYSSYRNFMKMYASEIDNNVFFDWQYKRRFTEDDEKETYTVEFIADHPDNTGNYQRRIAVIHNSYKDKTFLFDVEALEKIAY